MSLHVFIIDAFADQPFEGNPAAVCPLEDLAPDEDWPDDDLLQAMAGEHNLSETAFIRPTHDPHAWSLRWFTPTVEVPLCGHATLASGFVALEHFTPEAQAIRFSTASGELTVMREGERFAMALPARAPTSWTAPPSVLDALGEPVIEALRGEYSVLALRSEDAVRDLDVATGVAAARLIDGPSGREGCLTITAPAEDGLDFVSRFFAPGCGIDEDPVTGSSFCDLAPYWAAKLGKTEVLGFQASRRGGRVACRYTDGGDVVLIGGAVEYLRGEVQL